MHRQRLAQRTPVRLGVVLLALAGFPAAAPATVALTEPNEQTVAQSEVVAVAVAVSVAGKAAFTNARPPAVVFRVKDAIKGCRAGELLRVSGWVDENATSCSPKGVPLPEAECRARERERLAAEVAAPAPGSVHLLFLARDAGNLRPVFGQWRRRMTFSDPKPHLVELVKGLASFTFEAPRTLGELSTGSPIVLRGSLKNVAAARRTFDPARMVLHGQIPGADLREVAARSSGGPASVTLAPGEARAVEWDLAKLFPVVLGYPGAYALRLEVPAHCTGGVGNSHHVSFTVKGTASLELSVASSGQVFVARAGERVPQSGGRIDVVLNDREVLKSGGGEGEVPLMMPWPHERIPLPRAGDWLIVCASGGDLRCAVPRTPESLARVKTLIAGAR